MIAFGDEYATECVWEDTGDGKRWKTGCGNSISLGRHESSPAAQRMIYCQFCGNPIGLGEGTIEVSFSINSHIKLYIPRGTVVRTGGGWTPHVLDALNAAIKERGIDFLMESIGYDYYSYESKS